MATEKIKEALYYQKEAEEAARKGWFKSPEWDEAAQFYDKAGQIFGAHGLHDKAIECFEKAAKAHSKTGS